MKHAYMIMAHTNLNQLQKLIDLIDHPCNDIFIHIDLKCHINEEFKANSKFSKIKILDKRINVQWGDKSQVICELELLKEATREEHIYYHLISGMDLPLKSQEYIHNFFEQEFKKNKNKQFISFDMKKDFSDRIKYYYLPRSLFKRGSSQYKLIYKIYNKVLFELENISLLTQRMLKINRLKKLDIKEVGKGSQWFSITHEFALYILKEENLIKDIIRNSDCVDEIFLHTLFKKKYNIKNLDEYSNLRYIDWNRGKPYIFKEEDYNDIMCGSCIFARKFDEKIDNEIILKIYNNLK